MTYSHRERTSCEHRGFYRNPYHGWVAGVCAGIAERMGISPIWLRLLAIFGSSRPQPDRAGLCPCLACA